MSVFSSSQSREPERSLNAMIDDPTHPRRADLALPALGALSFVGLVDQLVVQPAPCVVLQHTDARVQGLFVFRDKSSSNCKKSRFDRLHHTRLTSASRRTLLEARYLQSNTK